MRAVVQRVSRASVDVGDDRVAEIGSGMLVLVGIDRDDGPDAAAALAHKLARMRIFPDDDGHMNLSVLETGGEALVVSQFTLLADLSRGRRPSFLGAAAPEVAEPAVGAVAAALEDTGVPVQTGRFGATMSVELVNDGPVTIVVDI